ncbi:GNAT family N-acetyltransferase [Actinomycetes bacterium KLBMP 9759]
MPFAVAWTDAEPAVIGRLSMQHYWEVRARFAPAAWELNLLVRHEGRVIGMQGLHASEFGISRELTTGSWIGMRNQRRGFGTEMRAAVLQFAFDHLGAVRVRSGAVETNTASRRVSQKLGYREDGTECIVRRGAPSMNIRLVLDEADFVRPGWTAEVEGLDACRDLLGISPG